MRFCTNFKAAVRLTRFRFRGCSSIPDGIGVIASLILAEWIAFTQDPLHFNDVKELMNLTKFGSDLTGVWYVKRIGR